MVFYNIVKEQSSERENSIDEEKTCDTALEEEHEKIFSKVIN